MVDGARAPARARQSAASERIDRDNVRLRAELLEDLARSIDLEPRALNVAERNTQARAGALAGVQRYGAPSCNQMTNARRTGSRTA